MSGHAHCCVACSQAQLAEGFHVSTHRYLYKVSALYKLLQEPSSIPLDLVLHGYYGTQCRPCKRSVLKCMHVLAHVCACVCACM